MPVGPPKVSEELILPCPPEASGTHESRGIPTMPPPPLPSTPTMWMLSPRCLATTCRYRASDPMNSTRRAPPSAGLVRPSDGHQPPTTFHFGPTARVTSLPDETTATGIFFHV